MMMAIMVMIDDYDKGGYDNDDGDSDDYGYDD